MGAPAPINIAEPERRARRLLTPGLYDYYAGGVGREQTLRANVRASYADGGLRTGEDMLTAHAHRPLSGDGTHGSA